MKRLFTLLLALSMLFTLCACQGNFAGVNLKDPIEIPDNGVVEKSTIGQIKNENAIAVFVGKSGDLKYEWTVFGSDIQDTKNVNLSVKLTEAEGGEIGVVLMQEEAFGFSALLSIYLNEQWQAQTATACVGENVFAAVSITGSKATILNLTLDGGVRNFVICPDPLPEDAVPTQPPTEEPTDAPTRASTNAPTEAPTEAPAQAPTQPPTEPPTQAPTQPPTEAPTEKDKYLTDPVPEGKPKPVEPEDQDVNNRQVYTCYFAIECSTILNNLDQLDPAKLELIPSGGVILARTAVTFYEGESVFDVLQRVCKERGIHMESSWTPIYNSAYIEGIHNLYEFDCGSLSGWMYRVNGWYPNYGCSRYQLQDGDVVEWRFTCDLGNDIGGGYAAGG